MHQLLKGVKRKLFDALSLDRMSEKYHVLVANYVFLMLYTTLESVFVNTLLYTIDQNISNVILYRGITYVSSAATMHIAAYLGQKKTPLVVIKTGAALYFLMYVVLFAGLNNMRVLMFPVAFLSGAGGAFYWVGHNVCVTNYTAKNNRDIGIAILGIVQGIMSLFIPVISGYVIALMPGTTGYRVMFGVGMVAVGCQIFIQKKLYPIAQKKHVSQAQLAWKLLLKKTSVKLMMIYEYMRGVRDGTFAFIMNMLLFEIITNESLVGINTFLSGVAAITGSWAYGKLVRPYMRSRIVLVAAGILVLTCLPLFALMNAATVMTYSLISSFVTLFIIYAANNSTFDVVAQNETMRKCMGEMLAIREGAMCLGRLSGLGTLMLFPHDQRGYVQAILVLTATQFVCGIFLKFTQNNLNRKKTLDQIKQADAMPTGSNQ